MPSAPSELHQGRQSTAVCQMAASCIAEDGRQLTALLGMSMTAHLRGSMHGDAAWAWQSDWNRWLAWPDRHWPRPCSSCPAGCRMSWAARAGRKSTVLHSVPSAPTRDAMNQCNTCRHVPKVTPGMTRQDALLRQLRLRQLLPRPCQQQYNGARAGTAWHELSSFQPQLCAIVHQPGKQ